MSHTFGPGRPLLAPRADAGQAARGFARDQSGAVAVIFGLLLLPMIGALGLAIDFGKVATMRTKAQMAADAAALQAAGVARDMIQSGGGNAVITQLALNDAKVRATKLFDASSQVNGLSDYTVNVTVERQGQTLSANAAYTVNSKNYLASIFGYSTFSARGDSTATSSLPHYVSVYTALDVSASMAIAANLDEMTKLFNADVKKPNASGTYKPVKCVFGCHLVASWLPAQAETNSTIAKRFGIKLRIDVLRQAVIDMVDTASRNSPNTPVYQLALYTFGLTASPDLRELSKISSDFASLKQSAAMLDIYSGDTAGTSYFDEAIPKLVDIAQKSGDGASRETPKKYVFIITDGLRSVPSKYQSNGCKMHSIFCIGPVDKNTCSKFKANDVIVSILYTTYVPIPRGLDVDNDYGIAVANKGIPPLIAPALQDCASPGWYFEASDGAGIDKALKIMFQQTTLAPSLAD